MSATVGQAWVEIVPSARGFGQRLNAAVGKDVVASGSKSGATYSKGFSEHAKKGLGSAAKGMFGPLIGAAAGLVAFDKAKDFIAGAVDEARESQVVGARTANVIKKMGASAWTSSKQIGNLATSLSNKVGIDDEAIQSGENLLLTFGNIRNEAGRGNDIFNQTSKIMVDMSAAMGQDMKSSAVQLGKALNDPVKGVSALSRVGVSFTAQQKDQIKTLVDSGKTLGAQKIILREVQKEFGGAAAKMATPGQKMSVAWGNLKEQIGTALLPVLDKAERVITKKVIPTVSRFIKQMQNGKGAGGKFVDILKRAAKVLETVGGWIKKNSAWLIPLVGTLATAVAVYKTIVFVTGLWTKATALLNTVMALNPIGLIVIAIAALVVGFILAYKKSETFRKIVNGALHAVAAAAKWVVGFIKSHWKTLLAILTGPIGLAVLLITKNWDKIKAGAGAVKDWIVGRFTALVGFITSLPGKIGRAASGMWDGIKNAFRSAINFIIDGWNSIHLTLPAVDTHIPGVGKVGGFTLSVPQLPRLATGGRATGAQLAMIGEGREPETVFPDSVLGGFLERMAAASGGGLPDRVRLVLADGTELDAYFEEIADDRIGAHKHLGDETRRAG